MVYDGHGTCLSVNPWGMQEMKSKGDLVGTHFLDIWHPDFKMEAEKHMTAVLAGRHGTFEAVRYNGDDLAWWSVKLTPILDSSNDHNPKFILFGSNISEEKQTKNWLNSLRNTEERYIELENILNSMLDPVHITNRDFEVEFVNRACGEIFGFHPPRIKCYKYFHDFESPCKWCRHEEVMMGKSYHTESYFEKTKTYFDANHSPITKANGEIAKLVILRDVTERKAAEVLLTRRNEEKTALLKAIHTVLFQRPYKTRAKIIFNSCKQLVKATAGYVVLLNKDGTENEVLFLDAGGIPCTVDSSLSMPVRGLREQAYATGKIVKENDFQNSKWVQFIPEGHAALSNVMFVPLLLNNTPVGLIGLANKEGGFGDEDASIATAFGELAAIALSNSQMHDAMAVNIEKLSNMTLQLDSEMSEKNKAIEDLRQSEENYRSLVTNIEQRHFIYSHNTDGVFTYLSPSITSILGYSSEEFMTHYETYLTDNPANKLVKEFTELCLSGRSQPPYELEIYHKDGRKIWLEVVELPVMDNNGNVTGLQGVAQDISERKKAQEAHLMNAQVEAMRKLIAGLSHEIRNPLFGISSVSQILQREIADEKYLPMIKALNAESNRIANLIKELNMYAAPKTPIISHIDLRSFIDKLQLNFSEKYSGVTFKVNIEPSLTLKGDESLIAYAIEQLFENSCHADATEIGIDIYLSGEQVNFSIRDNGKGINEKDMLKCFEPFYTTKQGSTGLGLFLSKKLIEMHGGRFNISSRVGEGTSISISI